MWTSHHVCRLACAIAALCHRLLGQSPPNLTHKVSKGTQTRCNAPILSQPSVLNDVQTHPWSPAKTNIAIVRSPAKAVDSATIRVSRTPGPPRVAELANQRTTTGSESALGHPAQDPGSEAPQQATPAGKRAVRAAISQLREVSQAPPKSRIPAYSPPGPDAGAQPRRERSIRGPGHRPLAGAELAKRGRQLDSKQASPGRRLPHLRAAMMETSVRTNALLLETGGSAGSGLSMQGSRVAMRSIGEAQRAASTERSIHSVASSRGAQGASRLA